MFKLRFVIEKNSKPGENSVRTPLYVLQFLDLNTPFMNIFLIDTDWVP